MFTQINNFITWFDGVVWGLPLIILILITGFLLTVRLGVLQVRHLGKALKFMVKNEEGGEGEVTSFGALCTALSATIGTGNIVGVATAIAAGGPGALFWMDRSSILRNGNKVCGRIAGNQISNHRQRWPCTWRPILLYRKWYGQTVEMACQDFCIFRGWSWTVWHWYFYPGKWYCVCS